MIPACKLHSPVLQQQACAVMDIQNMTMQCLQVANLVHSCRSRFQAFCKNSGSARLVPWYQQPADGAWSPCSRVSQSSTASSASWRR
jgi:hypothetical protein